MGFSSTLPKYVLKILEEAKLLQVQSIFFLQDHHCHRHYHTFHQEEAELEVNKKLLAKVFLLKDIWRTREPKVNYQQQQQHQ